MNFDTVNHPLWPHDEPEVEPDENECQECGSMNTFWTCDDKLVCRKCWHVEDMSPTAKYDMDPIHEVFHVAMEKLNKLQR